MVPFHVQALKVKASNIRSQLSCKNDSLLVYRGKDDAASSALVGIKLKKDLHDLIAARQAEMEYFIFGGKSDFPFVQLLTDLRKGGIFFFWNGAKVNDERALLVLEPRVVTGMEKVWGVLQEFISSIPDLGQSGQEARFSFFHRLGSPVVVHKLPDGMVGKEAQAVTEGLIGSSSLLHSLLHQSQFASQDDNDIARVEDLDDFFTS